MNTNKSVHILIIDDDRSIRSQVKNLLLFSGFNKITSIGNGVKICDILESLTEKNSSVDIILLDIHMPFINGLDICKQIKSTIQHKNIPVIMMSGDNDIHKLKDALELGAVDFLTKPVKKLELLARLGSVIRTWELENRLRTQANYDALTGLANRRLLMDRCKQVIARAKRDGTNMAILFFDINNFKELNDTLGHDAGDIALKIVASKLLSRVRSTDTVARLGGDEFIVMLVDYKHPDEVDAMVEELTNILNKPVILNGKKWQMGLSVGIATCKQVEYKLDKLFECADKNMYREKSKL